MKIIDQFKTFGVGPTNEDELEAPVPLVSLIIKGADLFIGRGNSPYDAAESALSKAKDVYELSTGAPKAAELWLDIRSYDKQTLEEFCDKAFKSPLEVVNRDVAKKEVIFGWGFFVFIAILSTGLD